MNTTRWPASGPHRARLVVACLGVLLLGLAAFPASGASAAATTSRLTTGFSSNFNQNHNGWSVPTGTWEHFNGSVFRTEGVPGELASIARIGKFADFTYEARMKRLGCSSCANRLVVRSRIDLSSGFDFAPAFFFQYTNEAPGDPGRFSVFKIKADGTSIAVKGWTETPAVNKGGWNILKVEAVGNHFRFYINGTLVWEGSRTGISTGRVGISMYTDSASTGEDFRVDWARLTLQPNLIPGFGLPIPAGAMVPGGSVDRSPGA